VASAPENCLPRRGAKGTELNARRLHRRSRCSRATPEIETHKRQRCLGLLMRKHGRCGEQFFAERRRFKCSNRMKQILVFLVAINTLEKLPAGASEFQEAASTRLSDRSGDKAAATQILIEGVIVEVPSRESNRSSRKREREALAPRDCRQPDAVLTGAKVLWATNFVSAEGNDVAVCKVSRFCSVATLGDDLDTLMAVLANDRRLKVLSRPRVMTSNGVPANIFIGSTVPYVHGIYSGPKRRSSSCFAQVGSDVSLQLTLVTSPQGLIVIELRQPIDQLDAGKFPGIDVPVVSSAELQAHVSVTNRQTFMLGGGCVTPENRGVHRKRVLRPIDMRGATLLVSSPPKKRRELIALFRTSVLPALESKTESVSQRSTLNPQPTVEPPAGAAPARFLYKRNPQAAARRRKWPAKPKLGERRLVAVPSAALGTAGL
jgi:type II/III secretion system protein